MNYLAHGWKFTDNPYFLAGTAVPDWLSVADRGVRVRSKRAANWIDHAHAETAAVARGICQHHADDGWFHNSRAFSELSLDFARRIRRALPSDEGIRPWFVGHILVEMLLDAALVEERPARLVDYYAALAQVDGAVVEAAVNRIAPQPTQRISDFISRFCRERFLYDYSDDGKLLVRLNQVMLRVRLPALPASLLELFPALREAIRKRRVELSGNGSPST